MTALPVIDVSALVAGDPPPRRLAAAIDDACRRTGFFLAVGHGLPEDQTAALLDAARRFFALADEVKRESEMALGGRAWRGWFPLGGELTSGVPDHKEGLYFGVELDPGDERVRRGTPLHGPNVFPAEPAELRPLVLAHMAAVTSVGHALLRGIAAALELAPSWFDQHLTHDPLVLFRIFRYPPLPGAAERWSVGEHTDYGLVTLLVQDGVGGLEVRTPDGWTEVPPVPGALVVNLGDMLERMTGGRYRSTPHRVRNRGGADRLSMPLFLDPAWDADVRPIPGPSPAGGAAGPRWDGASVHDWTGTYGEYLLAKVGRVFPSLRDEVLGEGRGTTGAR